eukprot:9128084-Karenia_brevis.AAC.1
MTRMQTDNQNGFNDLKELIKNSMMAGAKRKRNGSSSSGLGDAPSDDGDVDAATNGSDSGNDDGDKLVTTQQHRNFV